MARENTSFAGIVMYRRPYKERDLLVKFLTDKRGPMMFFVRGGNRSHAKITSDILPFTRGQYTGWLADDGSLSYLSAARDTRQYVHLGEDPLRSAYATYILELVDATFEEGRSIGGWFNQVAAALELIDKGQDPQIAANVLEVQFLPLLGAAQTWDRCTICGLNDRPLDFSEANGGMLCSRHWNLDERRFHLDCRTVGYLQLFASLNLAQVNQIQVDQSVKNRLRYTLDRIYDDELGLHLKSKRFIDQMATWENQLKNLRSEN